MSLSLIKSALGSSHTKEGKLPWPALAGMAWWTCACICGTQVIHAPPAFCAPYAAQKAFSNLGSVAN